MNVLMILLLIASILLTMIGASKKSVRIMISGCLSFSMSLLTVIGDILIRLSKDDSAGVMDIYPTMMFVYLVVFFIVGITCFVGYGRSR